MTSILQIAKLMSFRLQVIAFLFIAPCHRLEKAMPWGIFFWHTYCLAEFNRYGAFKLMIVMVINCVESFLTSHCYYIWNTHRKENDTILPHAYRRVD